MSPLGGKIARQHRSTSNSWMHHLVNLIRSVGAAAIIVGGCLADGGDAAARPMRAATSGPSQSFETITQFSTGEQTIPPYQVTTGPDENLWFTSGSGYGDWIGRMTPSGQVTTFSGIPSGSGVDGIASGPDGAVWFTEVEGNRIGRITTSGEIMEYPIPTANSQPVRIAAGPDGDLWFTEAAGHRIGRITPSGEIAEFTIPGEEEHEPYGITAGPDGNVWFTDEGDNEIGRVTASGEITEFSTEVGPGFNPVEITTGSDGDLWFTDESGEIGRITPTGVVTEVPVGGDPYAITPGPEGDLWFTEWTGKRIGRITTTGSITEYATGMPNDEPSQLFDITTGPEDNVWFSWFTATHGYVARFAAGVPAPSITKISPKKGPATGGTDVTITGKGLTGARSVEFGATAAASFQVESDTMITAVAPPGQPGTVNVSVTTPVGSSALKHADHFKYEKSQKKHRSR